MRQDILLTNHSTVLNILKNSFFGNHITKEELELKNEYFNIVEAGFKGSFNDFVEYKNSFSNAYPTHDIKFMYGF